MNGICPDLEVGKLWHVSTHSLEAALEIRLHVSFITLDSFVHLANLYPMPVASPGRLGKASGRGAFQIVYSLKEELSQKRGGERWFQAEGTAIAKT